MCTQFPVLYATVCKCSQSVSLRPSSASLISVLCVVVCI